MMGASWFLGLLLFLVASWTAIALLIIEVMHRL